MNSKTELDLLPAERRSFGAVMSSVSLCSHIPFSSRPIFAPFRPYYCRLSPCALLAESKQPNITNASTVAAGVGQCCLLANKKSKSVIK